MQHFVRPASRVVRGHTARLGLERASFLTRSTTSQTPIHALYSSKTYVSARNYSSQPPPNTNDTIKTPSEANASNPADAKSAVPTGQLPSTMEKQRSAINRKFSSVMDNVQARVLTASQTLNDITGYTSIDAIKAENEGLEKALADAQERVRVARQTYKSSNSKRAATQREVTTLLARKDTWSPVDLERFTELYRTDHVLEGEVVAAQENLTESEADEQSLNQRLNAGILKRYHEEQIWSDRIRRASTWGTWGLMGMNFVLFVILQFFAEPWRRRRLVKGVVEQEKQVLEGVRGDMEALKTRLEEKLDSLAALSAKTEQAVPGDDAEVVRAAITWQQWLRDPKLWQETATDLCSERKVNMTMRDASVLAAEGAAAGAALTAAIVLLVLRS